MRVPASSCSPRTVSVIADDVMRLVIVSDIPACAIDTSQDDVRLLAQTTAAGSTTVTTASVTPTAGVDVVFADSAGTTSDGNRDGQHSDPCSPGAHGSRITSP